MARSATTELFANSPMWWMCVNHNPSGAAYGGNDLQSWNHRQHAVHLAKTARRARDSWGVNFRTVDPFNEPASTWWTAGGTQEGCHHIRPGMRRDGRGRLRRRLRPHRPPVRVRGGEHRRRADDHLRPVPVLDRAGEDRYVRRADVVPSGRLVRLAFPAASVQTVEVDGVVA